MYGPGTAGQARAPATHHAQTLLAPSTHGLLVGELLSHQFAQCRAPVFQRPPRVLPTLAAEENAVAFGREPTPLGSWQGYKRDRPKFSLLPATNVASHPISPTLTQQNHPRPVWDRAGPEVVTQQPGLMPSLSRAWYCVQLATKSPVGVLSLEPSHPPAWPAVRGEGCPHPAR